MKKTVFLLSILLLFYGLACPEGVSVKLCGGYFKPAKQTFEDIYGGGMTYGAEVTVGIWKNLELWAGGSTFTKKGELTYTKEETTVDIIPVGSGIRYVFISGRINLYAGAGLAYHFFKETNVIGDVSTGNLGYSINVGGFLKLIQGLFIDIGLKYSSCEIVHSSIKADIDGLALSLSLGYHFQKRE